MFKATVFFVLALFSAIHGLPVESEWDWRVVGGSNAGNGAVPYQVSLRSSSNSHFCGGSIISPRTILTAAHCLNGRTASNTVVVVGTNTLNAGGTTYQATSLKIKEDYIPAFIINDIGLVILSQDIEFGDKVKAIELGRDYTDGGATVVLSGWGTTSYPGTAPNDLQIISLLTQTYEQCKSAHSRLVVESQICTLTKAGEGACHGDSGGPLTAGGKVVGIVSWGMPCAIGYPDVFTRVSSFTAWIDSNKA
ncbi:chymotrypsin-2-like isoform X2 [Arctopsyche grandis]|uniref:chymotrypsin-2-like isoform X2 n=1 Tax=Arctopsyche grandis TaxID=121162 RepID=UPI00406D878A